MFVLSHFLDPTSHELLNLVYKPIKSFDGQMAAHVMKRRSTSDIEVSPTTSSWNEDPGKVVEMY